MASVIAVTGLPGAWSNQVVRYLEAQNVSLLWPNQDLDYDGAQNGYSNNGENPELARIHETILGQAGTTWFTTRAPRFYDIPLPGPDEYLAQFQGCSKIVIADPRLCFFLPMWRPYVKHLLVSEFPFESSVKQIARFANESPALDLCREVAQHYTDRLKVAIKSMGSAVTVIPHGLIKQRAFGQTVDGVLKSTFGNT